MLKQSVTILPEIELKSPASMATIAKTVVATGASSGLVIDLLLTSFRPSPCDTKAKM